MNHPLAKTTPQFLRSGLKLFIALSFGVSLACSATAQNPTATDRPYFNDKKAPNADDLIIIQKLLKESAERVRPATVCVQLEQGSGSGVIISEDGLVLTAAHVSAGVDNEIKIITEDGTEYNARTLGLNATNDAAMIQIIDKGPFPYVEIETAKTRDNASTKLGDWVFSLGHSGGFDKERGSGLRLGRLVRIANETIQSDCTLIGGDSGGPLFDINGTLIGIHSRVGGVNDINLHVPIHVFHTHWVAMKQGEFIGPGPFAQKPVPGQAFIGIAIEKVANGLKVTDVDKESPAGKADIQIGDIITKANSNELIEKATLADLMKDKASGDILILEIIKQGEKEPVELKLKLGNR